MVDRTLIACALWLLLGATASAEETQVSKRLSLGVDLVLGSGATRTLDQTEAESRASAVRADVQVASLVAAAEYAITESVSAGMHMPLTLTRIVPAESASRVTFAPGNWELEGEIEIELVPGLELQLAMVVALPTATGSELPSDEELATSSQADATRQLDAYDAFSAQRAATSVRGHEEDPLFEPGYLGLVPTFSIDYRIGVFALHGYLEFENLIRTDPNAAYPFIGEIDVGIHLRYFATDLVELAAKAWTNAGLIGESDFIAAFEPQLRLHLDDCDFAAGFVVPFAGEDLDTSFLGIRLVASGRL